MHNFTDITDQNFEAAALEMYRYQYANNQVYGQFCDLIKRTPKSVYALKNIPFLPVELFKKHPVVTGAFTPETVFTSSTTSGGTPSNHWVKELAHYEQVYVEGFEREFGAVENWTVLALLPSYLERSGSSLVVMAEGMIQRSGRQESGFYLYNHGALEKVLKTLQTQQRPTLLLGVTFGLLDFAENISAMDFPQLRVMETGGMKGRRKELIRIQVHARLKEKFPSSPIDSEYGMTELLSQAYMKNSGRFVCPPWMRVYTRDVSDPLGYPLQNGSRGALQIIDLANKDSCCFLAVSDQGRVFENGTFEVYGRLDKSEIRGCNLMVSL
jgi:hypothetical protein